MSKPLPRTSFLYHIGSPDGGGGFCSPLNVIFQIKSLSDGCWSVSPAGDMGTGSPGPCIGSAAAWRSSVGGTGVQWITTHGFCPPYWFCVAECVCVCGWLWMCLCAVEIYGADSGCILESWSAESSHIPTQRRYMTCHYHSEFHMHSRFCSHLHSLFILVRLQPFFSTSVFPSRLLPLSPPPPLFKKKTKWWWLFN